MTFRSNVDSQASIHWNNFNSSNAVVCSYLIFANTVQLAIINVAELERNGWFFFFILIEECCVVIEKIIHEKISNRISYQIWYERCLKGKFGRGPKSAKEGPHPQADMDRRGGGESISVGGFWLGSKSGGSKSAVTPARLKVSGTTFSSMLSNSTYKCSPWISSCPNFMGNGLWWNVNSQIVLC